MKKYKEQLVIVHKPNQNDFSSRASIVDKKFTSKIMLEYAPTKADADHICDGTWKMYTDEPYKLLVQEQFPELQDALKRFISLNRTGKAWLVDLLIEYSYNGKLVASEYIDDLPTLGRMANIIAEQIVKEKEHPEVAKEALAKKRDGMIITPRGTFEEKFKSIQEAEENSFTPWFKSGGYQIMICGGDTVAVKMEET